MEGGGGRGGQKLPRGSGALKSGIKSRPSRENIKINYVGRICFFLTRVAHVSMYTCIESKGYQSAIKNSSQPTSTLIKPLSC